MTTKKEWVSDRREERKNEPERKNERENEERDRKSEPSYIDGKRYKLLP